MTFIGPNIGRGLFSRGAGRAALGRGGARRSGGRGGRGGDFGNPFVDSKMDQALFEAASEGQSTAESMVGNSGQESIIGELTFDDYYAAAEEIAHGGQGGLYVSHPEAVGEILAEAESAMAEVIFEALESAWNFEK